MSDSPVVGDRYTELLKLRIITERSGILHDAQVLQLKMWPWVLFDISEVSIIPDDRKRSLYFDIKFTKNVPSDLRKRADILSNWVWDLLGPQFRIQIRNARNGNVEYHGERKDQNWTPPPASQDEVKDDLVPEVEEQSIEHGKRARGKKRRSRKA